MYFPLKRLQKNAVFIGDVSIDWATGRKWRAKLLDTWQVTQINLHCQESVRYFNIIIIIIVIIIIFAINVVDVVVVFVMIIIAFIIVLAVISSDHRQTCVWDFEVSLSDSMYELCSPALKFKHIQL